MNKLAYFSLGKIFIQNKIRKRAMIVLKSKPCSKLLLHGRCLGCFFDLHVNENIDYNVYEQFLKIKDILIKEKIEHIDLIGVGSILDEKQIKFIQIKKIFQELVYIDSIKTILIEGRIEYFDVDKINELRLISNNKFIEYGVGLESYSDNVRKYLRKEIDILEFIHFLRILKKNNVGVCTYLLAGIPKFSKENNFKDICNSIIKINKLYELFGVFGRINIYPLFIVKNTFLEEEYINGNINLFSNIDFYDVLLNCLDYINLKKYPIFIGIDDEGLSFKNSFLNSRLNVNKINNFNISQNLEELL